MLGLFSLALAVSFAAGAALTARRDEIGAMAETVQVFKTNMIRADQLTADQEALKATAAASQKGALNKMADTFQAKVG